jgi:hypothetical protein
LYFIYDIKYNINLTMDSTLYGTNSTIIPKKTSNDNDLENRLYFTLLNKNINVCNPLSSTNMSNCNNFYNFTSESSLLQ